MFYDEYTLVAIGASIMGCLIRYSTQWKSGAPIRISYLTTDIIIAAFLGYITYWVVLDHCIAKSSYATVISCIIGNFGSKIFDIISWYLHTRHGIPNFKYGDKRQ